MTQFRETDIEGIEQEIAMLYNGEPNGLEPYGLGSPGSPLHIAARLIAEARRESQTRLDMYTAASVTLNEMRRERDEWEGEAGMKAAAYAGALATQQQLTAERDAAREREDGLREWKAGAEVAMAKLQQERGAASARVAELEADIAMYREAVEHGAAQIVQLRAALSEGEE